MMKRQYEFNTYYRYTRIDKRQARKLYDKGAIIVLLGARQRIEYCIHVCKDFCSYTDFDNMVNSWEYYNKHYYGSLYYYIEEPIPWLYEQYKNKQEFTDSSQE